MENKENTTLSAEEAKLWREFLFQMLEERG
jgi:hypothetical protein